MLKILYIVTVFLLFFLVLLVLRITCFRDFDVYKIILYNADNLKNYKKLLCS